MIKQALFEGPKCLNHCSASFVNYELNIPLTSAWLHVAQLGEHRPAERKVVGPTLRVVK